MRTTRAPRRHLTTATRRESRRGSINIGKFFLRVSLLPMHAKNRDERKPKNRQKRKGCTAEKIWSTVVQSKLQPKTANRESHRTTFMHHGGTAVARAFVRLSSFISPATQPPLLGVSSRLGEVTRSLANSSFGRCACRSPYSWVRGHGICGTRCFAHSGH